MRASSWRCSIPACASIIRTWRHAGGNLLPGYDMISDIAAANDGDGRDPDASDPGDWVTEAEISMAGGPFHDARQAAEDSSWHGTQVAGLIAALTDNGIGMASVARSVRILPVRVLGKCGGFDSDIIAGMRWAAGLAVPGVPANANPAKVINLSLGSEGPCSAAYQQVDRPGERRRNASSSRRRATPQATRRARRPTATAPSRSPRFATSERRSVSPTSVPRSRSVRQAATASMSRQGRPASIRSSRPRMRERPRPVRHIYTDSFNAVGRDELLVAARGGHGGADAVGAADADAAASADRPASDRPTVPDDRRRQWRWNARPAMHGTAVQRRSGNPSTRLQCYCTIDTCGAGMLDAGAAVVGAKPDWRPPAFRRRACGGKRRRAPNRVGASTSPTRATFCSRPGSPTIRPARRGGCR